MKKNLIFVLSLLFFLLSCSKDDDSEPLDPTEAVELTVKFQFQYFSSDISLSEVSANLKYSQSSSMIIESVSSNVSGQPGEYKLVLSVRGVEAENLINEPLCFLETKIKYHVDGTQREQSTGQEINIRGGEQTTEVDYELVSVETVEIIINTHFSYTHFNVTLLDRIVRVLCEDLDFHNPIAEDKETDIYDEPEIITSKFTLEGEQALENIGKTRWIVIRIIFKVASSYKSYEKVEQFVVEEGVQEFDFYFSQ